MASETEKPVETAPLLTSKALVEFVSTVPTEKLIDSFVEELATMTPGAVPILVARATPIRKALQYIEKIAESRIASSRILNYGDEWVDPEQGVVYVFKGEQRERSMPDAAGCRAALLNIGAPKDMVTRAIYDVAKVNFVELNNLAKMDPRYAEIIDDFEAERGFAPAHLKEAK
jgi:hypothetical protein